jgi:inosose dehydratase
MSRKFPKDKEVLKKELSSRGIQLVSQWKSVLLSDPAYHEQELRAFREHALFLQEMGAAVISTCEVGGSLHFDPRRSPFEKEVLRLNDEQWKWLAEGLNKAGEIARELGMKLTYHHHGGTVVEQPEEIDRLMEMTDPELVYLLYDTGHAYYGGNDPLQLLLKYYDRIAYIHLKDVRQEVLDQARAEGADFVTCIRKGVFTVPGDGSLDFAPILKVLVERDYRGWIMLEGEQDPAVNNPYELAKKAIEYIDTTISLA